MDDGLLTVEQAAAAFDVTTMTLRRRAQYGEIEGAVKVRGRRGQEWRVPTASLVALGYEPRDQQEPGVADLVVVVRRLSEVLREAQQENARLNRELGGAVAEAAGLRRQLETERHLRSVVPRGERQIDLRDPARAGDR